MCQIIMSNVHNGWKLLKHFYLKVIKFHPYPCYSSASFYWKDKIITPPYTHARVGIALYGSRPYSSLNQHDIVQSLMVKAHVIQVREVHAGDYCGYSFAFQATKNIKSAVIDIGYGDELRTRAKHEALINGKRYPIRALMMSHMFVEVHGTQHAR